MYVKLGYSFWTIAFGLTRVEGNKDIVYMYNLCVVQERDSVCEA